MPGMDFFLGLSVLSCRAALFQLNDVKSKLGLNDVADLAGLQGERGLLKLWQHFAMSKPVEVTAFVFASRIGGKLFRKCSEVFTGARSLQNLFGLCASLFAVEFRMLRDVGI